MVVAQIIHLCKTNKNNASWPVIKWRRVVFSDESRFKLSINDRRLRIWRRPIERFRDQHNHTRLSKDSVPQLAYW